MDISEASILFDALSQETRLGAFRLLIQAGPTGMQAGLLSESLGVPNNTMSFHLKHMANAGLVESHREGRIIVYIANFALIHKLVEFMVKDCCSKQYASIRNDKKSGCSIIELGKAIC